VCPGHDNAAGHEESGDDFSRKMSPFT
jgi:hypothetical protein